MKKIFFTIVLILALTSFYQINTLNYQKIQQIKQNTVEHPENLPNKETIKYSTFGYANLRADFLWLQAIQYIGGNAISSDYKKYLYVMLDLITELNPFFQHPYIIGELLLPTYNARYETLSDEEQQQNINQAIKIGEKGVAKFCDEKKLALIKHEFNLQKLWSEPQYKNPCKSPDIAYNLAYVYYFYLHDGETASYYYRVASANEDSLEGAKLMSAIMQGKGGDREKSFFMFLNMASSVEGTQSVCSDFSNQLNSLALNGRLRNDTQTIQSIEETRNKLFPRENIDENDGLGDTHCSSYLNKAIRELNLSYIEAGHAQYLKEKGKAALDAKEVYDEGYIDFLPTDFQQGKDQGIIYYYNGDTGHFDYKMGKSNYGD